jgi:hypothetical protein
MAEFLEQCINLYLASKLVYEEAQDYLYRYVMPNMELHIPGQEVLLQLIKHMPEDFINHMYGSLYVEYDQKGSENHWEAIEEILDLIANDIGFDYMDDLRFAKPEWFVKGYSEQGENTLEIPREDIERPGDGEIFLRLDWQLEYHCEVWMWYGDLKVTGALGELKCLEDIGAASFYCNPIDEPKGN